MLASGGLSFFLKLNMEKSILLGTIRAYVQLFFLGYILRWVFTSDSWWVVIGIILLMISFASLTVQKRSKILPKTITWEPFVSMLISGITVIFAVTAVIIRVQPWYLPKYVIPIAGMVIGNSMNGIALSIEIMFSDMKKRRDEVNMMLAMGASPWEVSLSSVRHAIYSGLTPTINSMMVVGVVFIPGMMTGQVLGGVDPAAASRYQIVVMLMISASTAVGSILALVFTYRRMFNSRLMFVFGD